MEEPTGESPVISKIKNVRSKFKSAPVENIDDENVILQRLKQEAAVADRKRKALLAERFQKTRAKTLAIDAVSGLCAAGENLNVLYCAVLYCTVLY